MNKTKRMNALKGELTAKNALLSLMRKKANTLTDSAKEEAEAKIAEYESAIESIKLAIEELDSAEEDKTEELQAKIAELQAKQAEMQNSLASNPMNIGKKAENFVNSADGLRSFLDCVKNSTDGKDFRSNWKNTLTKNGIEHGADVFVPQAVVTSITDAWSKKAGEFLKMLDLTGLRVFKAVVETADVRALASGAHGHTMGAEKKEQSLTLESVEIRGQYIYKYLTIDREVLDENDENGALAKYIAYELANRMLNGIMRAVIWGGDAHNGLDGVTKFKPLTQIDNKFVLDASGAFDLSTPENIIPLVATEIAKIKADGDKVLLVSPSVLIKMKMHLYGQGGTYSLITDEELAGMIGVSKIFATDVMTSYGEGGEANGYAVSVFVPKAYKLVGDLRIDSFENFVLAYNKKEFLAETWCGGAPTELAMAVTAIRKR